MSAFVFTVKNYWGEEKVALESDLTELRLLRDMVLTIFMILSLLVFLRALLPSCWSQLRFWRKGWNMHCVQRCRSWLGGDFSAGLCCGQRWAVLERACAEQEWGSRALAAGGVYWGARGSKQEGEKPLNLSHKLFWPYGMCCSWSFPGTGKKPFSSTFSSLVRTFPLSWKFLRGFSVELDMENIANVIYPFLWTVKLAVQSACKKSTLLLAGQGFPQAVRLVFP